MRQENPGISLNMSSKSNGIKNNDDLKKYLL